MLIKKDNSYIVSVKKGNKISIPKFLIGENFLKISKLNRIEKLELSIQLKNEEKKFIRELEHKAKLNAIREIRRTQVGK